MKIDVRFRGIAASEALREHTVRRIHFQLSRFNGEVGSVVVSIMDINGPKGGVDKRCQVTARGRAFPPVTIEELNADPYSAVDVAIGRAARTVMRGLERTRTDRRDGWLGRSS